MDTRWKPSVTVAAVIAQGGRYLLVEEHTPEGLRLNNPAGHLDPGESPVEGCVREVLEETACAFRPQALVGVYLSRFHRTGEGDTGIVRTLWMTPDEVRATAARHRSPLVLRCMEDHLAGQRYPLSLIHTDPSVHAVDLG